MLPLPRKRRRVGEGVLRLTLVIGRPYNGGDGETHDFHR
jgi:hypothetical protein